MSNETAWAGGFFEGEGYIGLNKRYNGLRMSLSSTDLDSLERFQEAVDQGSITGPYEKKGSTKPIWCWSASKRDAVIDVAAKLWPWLCSRRQEKVLEVIEQYSNASTKRYKQGGSE